MNCNVDLIEVATNSVENSEAAELFQVDVRGPVGSPPTQISHLCGQSLRRGRISALFSRGKPQTELTPESWLSQQLCSNMHF